MPWPCFKFYLVLHQVIISFIQLSGFSCNRCCPVSLSLCVLHFPLSPQKLYSLKVVCTKPVCEFASFRISAPDFRKKSRMRETLNLSTDAYSITIAMKRKKKETNSPAHPSPVTCPLLPVTSHLSSITCHVSPVTCHL